MDPPAVELREVVKRLGAATIGPVTLSVAPGQTLALVGPSGAGKSTLLRLLMGLAEPDAGAVLLHGRPVRPGDLERRRHVGYVVQGGGLFPHLTASGNVALVARHLGWPARRREARLAELAALARLPPPLLERYPGELSGGQAQRVGLMRALMLDPEVLLLDEPLGALDPETRAALQADLRAAFEVLGKTVVLVTHDLDEAAFFGHRMALLSGGRLLQEGTPEALRLRPASPEVARFLGAARHAPPAREPPA